MAVGLAGLHAGGLTTAQGFRGTPDSVAGQAVLDAHFPGGAGQPVQVFGNPGSGPRLAAALDSVPGLTAVTTPRVVAGHDYLEATLTAAPDSQAAYATVDRARAAVHAVPGADAIVGGNTAVNLDVQRASVHDRNLIIPIILLVVFVILTLLLRALVAPLLLMATVVLSFARRAGGELAVLQPRVPLRRRRPVVPAVRLRVPGRARHRLQHLPDDPGPRGGGPPRPAAAAR